MRRAGLVAGLVAATLASALIASPASGSEAQFSGVRQATASLHTVAKAEAAGYEKFLPCFDSPGVGGMGQHYRRPRRHRRDDRRDASRGARLRAARGPHAAGGGGVRRPAGRVDAVPSAPELFGEHFHRNDTLGIWALHAWIWRPNPDGMHADFNPKVGPC